MVAEEMTNKKTRKLLKNEQVNQYSKAKKKRAKKKNLIFVEKSLEIKLNEER